MIRLKKIGHVNLRVSDRERSKAFYIGVLGLTLQEEDPDHPHGGTHLSIPGGEDLHTLDLGQHRDPVGAQQPRRDQIGLNHIAFQVDSYEALREAYCTLLEHGVEVTRFTDHTSQRSVYFQDPDGNGLEIYYEMPNAREIFPGNRGDQDVELPVSRPGEPLPAWFHEDWPTPNVPSGPAVANAATNEERGPLNGSGSQPPSG